MGLVTVQKGETILHTHVNQFTTLLSGTSGGGQDVRLTQQTNAADYANVFGNVDATNGYAAKFQFGPVASPTTLMTVSKAAITLSVPLRMSSIAGSLGWYDIRDYGAVSGSGGAAATTTAITNALAAIASAGGGVLYIPPGTFYDNTNRSYVTAGAFAVVGAGAGISTLVPTTTSGDYLTVNGATWFTLKDIQLQTAVARPATSYLVSASNAFIVWIQSVYANTANRGRIFKLDTCNSAYITDTSAYAHNNATGDCVLRAIATCLSMDNNIFQAGATEIADSPCVWVTGTSNSARISNCLITGGGPQTRLTISSIADNGASFDVATTTAHGFAADDLVALRGVSVAAYNNQWRVSSVVSANIFRVAAPTGGGNVFASGTAESLAAALLFENSTGTYGETVVANVITARTANPVYGSVGIYFDAKRSAGFELQGFDLVNCWMDYGTTGILISGRPNGGGGLTAYGYSITNGKYASQTRPIHVDQAHGVTIDGVHVGSTIVAPVADGLNATAGIYLYAGAAAPAAKAISISNSHVGVPRDVSTGSLMPYGVLVDGAIDLLSIEGGIVGGWTAPIESINITAATREDLRWSIKPAISTSALPVTHTSTLPSMASAASIAAPTGWDTFALTGTTNIFTITNAWHKREITLLYTGAGLQLTTGGNLAVSAARTLATGDAVTLVFHANVGGGTWFVR